MPQFGGASEKCSVCSKTVYLAEKIVVEDKDEKKTFHKNCLKCTHCKATLSLGNYASMNGVMYCKPHFKQLFATKGNYDEGFGKDKLTSKWSPAPAPASQTAGSFVPVEKTDEKSSSEKNTTPAAIASKFGKTSIGAEKCETCGKTVYATEKIVIEEKDGKKVYHKACLKCTHCQVVVTLGNYAAMNGVTYCKPHFKQLFATKGNYDEGFGKDKHTTKWDPSNNAAPSTFVPVEKTDSPRDSKPAPAASSEVASRFKGMGSSDKCSSCGKTVYLTEKIVVEDKEDKKLFHKGCLRCSHCQVVLSLGSYASMGGVFYCKPHFKQLFATKGNYDEGFGKEKHTAKWIGAEAVDDKEAAETFGGSGSAGGSPRKEEEGRNEESLRETPHEETHHHEEQTHHHEHEEHGHEHGEHHHDHEHGHDHGHDHEHHHEEHHHEEHEHHEHEKGHEHEHEHHHEEHHHDEHEHEHHHEEHAHEHEHEHHEDDQ